MKRILIASVLKPVDDIRHYHKIALSIRKTNKYEIHIIGNASKNESLFSDVIFHPHRVAKSYLSRWKVQCQLISRLGKIRPDKFIVSTIELLPLACLFKVIFKYDLIYDMQENYYANFRDQSEYSRWKSIVGRAIVITIEKVFFRWIDQFWLAEKSYEKRVNQSKKRIRIFENKSLRYPEKESTPSSNKEIKFIFNGSVSEYSGVRKAIDLFNEFSRHHPNSFLDIIGVCQNSSLEKWLKEEQLKNPKIALFIEQQHINHQVIVNKVVSADIGIVAYSSHNDSANRMPTKCFEYAALGIPYIVEEHTYWHARGTLIGGAIAINFQHIDFPRLLATLASARKMFINTKESPFWDDYEQELLDSILL